MRRALIAGAGIAGLTSALALAKAGFGCVVFERAAALEAFGAGLQLSPNATRVLAALGALDPIAARATAPRAIRVKRGDDDAPLSVMDLSGAQARWGAPYLVIHRADLQAALAELCAAEPDIALRLGAEALDFEETGDGVTVNGERGDLLIGADGLRSQVRAKLFPGDAPAFAGRVAFRATLPAKAGGAAEVTLRLGRRAHLVQYPLRGGTLQNLVAVIESGWRGAPPQDPWDGEADRPALTRAFADWSRAARDLIAAPESWRAWPLYTRPALPAYARGRVALAGDAAHPMVPFLAQGAAQAIEDAGALARALQIDGEVPAALAAYSAARAPRASRVQREALAQTRIYHLSGPLALARDIVMRAAGPDRLLDRYNWLYGA
jgi:salicylate hydroxylase